MSHAQAAPEHTRKRRPDIVVVAIDSLRPDHLGCYGYGLPTSPHIDALAAESLVFDNAIAAGIPTMPAFTTLLSGMHPYRHRIVAHSGAWRLGEQVALLPELLKQQGYRSVAIDNLVIQGEGRGSWFARGYDHYSGFVYRPFGDQSRQLTDRALDFLKLLAGPGERPPLFLLIHYWDPHSPYGPCAPYDTLHYRPGSSEVELSGVRAIAPGYYEQFLGAMRLKHPDDYAYVMAQYDGEISQVDEQVGRLLQGLRARDTWDDTVVALLSDHGECFGEGGLFFDHHGLYDAVIRTALLVRGPRIVPGRSAALVSSEDLCPTLLELAGAGAAPAASSGISLVPLLRGRQDSPRSMVVSAESSRQASLALRTAEWKLIVPIVADSLGAALPDVYGRPRSSSPLLFHLPTDPHERYDLAAERPDMLRELGGMLDEWRAAMQQASGAPDPIMSQGLSLPYERFMARLFGTTNKHE